MKPLTQNHKFWSQEHIFLKQNLNFPLPKPQKIEGSTHQRIYELKLYFFCSVEDILEYTILKTHHFNPKGKAFLKKNHYFLFKNSNTHPRKITFYKT
jgi:hypothetical protein